MNLKRGAALLGGTLLLAVWLAAAAGTRRVPASDPTSLRPAVVTVDPQAAEVEAQAERLRARLNAVGVLQQPTRNPFQFGERPAPRASRVSSSSAPREVSVSPSSEPPPQVLLIGIAEDQTASGPTRTAVLSMMGQLFLAKQNDQVTPRFRVVAIGADAVELADLQTGLPLRLALR